MCQPKPGPRCAAHTKAAMVRATTRMAAAEATMQAAEPGTPEHERAAQAHRDAEMDAIRAQRDYNATPTGRKALLAQVAHLRSHGRDTEADQVQVRHDQALRRWNDKKEALALVQRMTANARAAAEPDQPAAAAMRTSAASGSQVAGAGSGACRVCGQAQAAESGPHRCHGAEYAVTDPTPAGFIDLYHRTTPAAAAAIAGQGVMTSRENTAEAFFSTFPAGGEGEGYGEAVVMVRVPRDTVEIDDEFPDGEEHYRVPLAQINRDTLMARCERCGRWAAATHACRDGQAAVPDAPSRPGEVSPGPVRGAWKAEHVIVMGRRFEAGQVSGGRLYHGTIHDIADGQMLTPGAQPANFRESNGAAVSITSDISRARHWAREAAKAQGLPPSAARVYEVEPDGPIEAHRVGLAEQGTSFHLWEARTPQARVVGVPR